MAILPLMNVNNPEVKNYISKKGKKNLLIFLNKNTVILTNWKFQLSPQFVSVINYVFYIQSLIFVHFHFIIKCWVACIFYISNSCLAYWQRAYKQWHTCLRQSMSLVWFFCKSSKSSAASNCLMKQSTPPPSSITSEQDCGILVSAKELYNPSLAFFSNPNVTHFS